MGNDTTLKNAVRARYAKAAQDVLDGASDCGCGCNSATDNPITRDLYSAEETAALPREAGAASLGCGNPTALADMASGEVVLDLGSGGGLDVLLSARRVGPTGFVYGLDMTDEMLELARENQRKAGVTNVEFLKGEMEAIPLPDASVDVIISNCVVNLSGDKAQVLREAYRVLRPGGRLAITDIVVRGTVPETLRRSVELWMGCLAGALEVHEFEALLRIAGFRDPDIEPVRIYHADDARTMIEQAGIDFDAAKAALDGRFMSAFVRAVKPSEALTTGELLRS